MSSIRPECYGTSRSADATGVSIVMKLPTREEINVHDSLDERTACEHFLGKSLEEAEALFRENSLKYQEDLMFMGASAFRFYVQAAINYIQSDQATEDLDMIRCFARILELRWEFEVEALVPIAPQLASVCRYIAEHHDRFTLQPDIDGDLRPRFRALEQTFRFTHAKRLQARSIKENHSQPNGIGRDIAFYVALLVPAGLMAYYLWAFALVISRYVAYALPGRPQAALTIFFLDHRILLLLFPAPWLLFAIYSLVRGPQSTRTLVCFSSTLILGLLALSVLEAIALAMPWIFIPARLSN